MDPQFLAIVLFLIGFLLILAEFFIPSGGAIAVMCVLSFVGSVFYAYKAWYHHSPLIWWGYLASFAVLVPAAFWGIYRLLTTTRFGDRILLRAPDLEDVTPHQEEFEYLSKFIGQKGKTLSLMSPGGMVIVNGERLHASVEGTMLQAGEEIIVTGVSGTRVLVAHYVEPPPQEKPVADDAAEEAPEAEQPADNPLDPFDQMDPFSDSKT